MLPLISVGLCERVKAENYERTRTQGFFLSHTPTDVQVYADPHNRPGARILHTRVTNPMHAHLYKPYHNQGHCQSQSRTKSIIMWAVMTAYA